MYCRCSADYADAPPNTHVCPVCLGMPGVLPVINQQAVEYTIMTALALNCEIPEYSKFDRKNYPYPDLMKGYQISQYDLPLSPQRLAGDRGGRRSASASASPASTWRRTWPSWCTATNEAGETYSLVDVNRAGVPADGDRRRARHALAGGGPPVPDEAAPDPPLPRRLHGQHGGGQLPLRRQHQHPPVGQPASSAPRSKSRT